MLTGRRLFRRDSDVATLGAVVRDPIPPIARTDMPPELGEVVNRALARAPDARHGSARELREDIRTAMKVIGGEIESENVASWLHDLIAAGPDAAELKGITAWVEPGSPATVITGKFPTRKSSSSRHNDP